MVTILYILLLRDIFGDPHMGKGTHLIADYGAVVMGERLVILPSFT